MNMACLHCDLTADRWSARDRGYVCDYHFWAAMAQALTGGRACS